MHLKAGTDLLIATGNKGKFAEFSALLEPFSLRLHNLSDRSLPEPEETGLSFVENARIKASAGFEQTGMWTLADDSGLLVHELGGLPGIYTADWAESTSGRSFPVAMQKTWDLLQAVGSHKLNSAEFRCVLVLVGPAEQEFVFEGVLTGSIVWPMRGAHGHGYDPIFKPKGHHRTLGEMAAEEKNGLSHRADAFAKMIQVCFT